MSTASQLTKRPLVERVQPGTVVPKSDSFFVLSRAWEEDGVWTVEAFDLPVAVFGNTFEEEQRSFDEAIVVHFWGLEELGKVKSTIKHLQALAKARTFFAERLLERDLREREVTYLVPMAKPHQLCGASVG